MVLDLHDIEIDSTTEFSIINGAKQVVGHIKTHWPKEDLKCKIYTNGISNKLIGVWFDNFDDQVLVRIYGEKTELFIDRSAETKNIQLLYGLNCGPELFAKFKNGLSYAYIPGQPVSTDSVKEEVIWTAISKQVAKLHKIEGETSVPCLFPKLRNFIRLLPDTFRDDHTKRLNYEGITKSYLQREADELETFLSSLNCPVVFSHNDLLLNNIIWDRNKELAQFIDYEYAAANFQPFDIANHFCEFVGVDVNLDYDKMFPNLEFQRNWVRQYLGFYFDKPADEISEEAIEKWLLWIENFTLGSHLFWGSWAFLQACHSSIDFDFLGYGIARLREFKKKKVKLQS